jgi:hypothetical protein
MAPRQEYKNHPENRIMSDKAEYVVSELGAQLLEILQRDCKMSPEDARAFVELRTGFDFDSEALYVMASLERLDKPDWCLHARIWRVYSDAKPPAFSPRQP